MNGSLPAISLVTPSLNQARYLSATLESVFAQEYPDLDYVVIDGGSADGSREIIASHAAKLSSWCSEPDGGMYAALNKGFSQTRGPIMGWLNSDDLLVPGALHAVGEIFGKFPQVEWLSSLSVGSWTETGMCRGYSTIEGFSRAAFLDGGYLPDGPRHYGWIPQESTFWRRTLWEKAGSRLEESFALAGDFELWCRFYKHADLIGTTTPLGGFRTHDAQKSRDMDRYLAEARPALERLRHDFRHHGSRIRRVLLRSRLWSFPGGRGMLSRRFGYSGTRAVADSHGKWNVDSHQFL